MFPGEEFRKWMDEKIGGKLGHNATFRDLQAKIESEGTSNLKYIFLTGSNLNTGKCEVFSHLHTPNMIIADAVRISMSIPIFFTPHQNYIRNENGNRVLDPTKKNSIYVDGGLLNNYPINMFDATRIIDGIETNFINSESLGFKLVSSDLKSKYESLYGDLQSNDKKINNFGKFLSMAISFFYNSEEAIHSDRIKDQERTIYIDGLDISIVGFDLKSEDKRKLVDSGRQAVRDYLQAKRNKNSIELFLGS